MPLIPGDKPQATRRLIGAVYLVEDEKTRFLWVERADGKHSYALLFQPADVLQNPHLGIVKFKGDGKSANGAQ